MQTDRTSFRLAVIGAIIATLVAGFFIFSDRRTGPDQRSDIAHGLDSIREDGTLVVLTVNSPTTYRERAGQVGGYEVDLTRAVAEDLGVAVDYRIFDDIPQLINAIEAGEGHIAVPGLSQREIRQHNGEGAQVVFSPAYKTVRPKAVCRRGDDHPDTVDAIGEHEVGVVAGSGIEETLQQHSGQSGPVDWQSLPVSSGLALLEQVHDGALDCAIVDSNIIALARRQYQELVTVFTLGTDDRQLVWSIAPQSADLNGFLKPWFKAAHQNGLLHDLDERYYGHLQKFDYLNVSTFRKRIDSRLPTYEDIFREAAGANDLDWTLLAAQGYQESHWDPTAKSPTGVRGLMMLTRPTAREVGIKDRLDPEQSIRGGAEYMERLYERMPDDVSGYDRLWMAMAAYNVGYGHLLDARRLAERQGLDKNKWRNIDDMLPLLTKKEYYSTVRYGYARGYEPVRYVRRIREYDEILTGAVPRPEQPPFLLAENIPLLPVDDEDSSAPSDASSGAPSGTGGDQ